MIILDNWPRAHERGAVSTIVVVLFSMGALFGFLALSIDFGRTVLERRELQNGADAGALAAARVCADNPSACTQDSLLASVGQLIDDNASDIEGHNAEVCGPALGVSCPLPDVSNLEVCPEVPAGFTQYVEVHTSTASAEGDYISNLFGAASGGQDRSVVEACARAAWGPPGDTGTTFPLTIRQCNWNAVTQNGTSFAPSPPYSPAHVTPDAAPTAAVPDAVSPYVTHILAHATGNPSDACGPTKYTPGGFGWLSDGATSDCRAVFSSNGTAPGDSGAAPTQGCKNDGMKQWVGKEVLIPVFSGVSGTGSSTTYTLAGISSFFFAGWSEMQTANPSKDYGVYIRPDRLPGSSENDMCMMLDPPPNQLKKATCIWGWFTSPILPVGSIDPTAPTRGPLIIQMAG
ncbi:hypothetical protein GA707_16795 [Nostocoides sp. F2B08]|uniref:pilus assembly protein TadG-related protein n=1 Tax=Nostocoides sp. F2B08 TaxID=2653936 RepID=UPI001262C6B1|nr:hypothetical protein GA707_16795 [Tetrasphaera sp. F2B08]